MESDYVNRVSEKSCNKELTKLIRGGFSVAKNSDGAIYYGPQCMNYEHGNQFMSEFR